MELWRRQLWILPPERADMAPGVMLPARAVNSWAFPGSGCGAKGVLIPGHLS